MAMRTGHLFVHCVDRHGHEDRTFICSVCGQTWPWGRDIYLFSVWTDMAMRTGHLFVQCVDRHGHEDRTHLFSLCLQTWSWGQDTYLCSMGTDIVMRTGHLCVQCGDRHSHEDRTLTCAVCRQTWSRRQDFSAHAPSKIELHQNCPLIFASRYNALSNLILLERGVCTLQN